MTMIKFLDFLKVSKDGEFGSGESSYTLDIEDSNEWGRLYSKFNKNEELEQLEDGSILTLHNASILYLYEGELGNYQVVLTADYDHNNYKLVINEV